MERKLWNVNCGTWIMECGLWNVNCGLCSMDGLWNVDCGMRIMESYQDFCFLMIHWTNVRLTNLISLED